MKRCYYTKKEIICTIIFYSHFLGHCPIYNKIIPLNRFFRTFFIKIIEIKLT